MSMVTNGGDVVSAFIFDTASFVAGVRDSLAALDALKAGFATSSASADAFTASLADSQAGLTALSEQLTVADGASVAMTASLATTSEAMGANGLAASADTAEASVGRLGGTLGYVERRMTFMGIILAAVGGYEVLKTAANFQTLAVSFGLLLGNQAQADAFVKTLYEFQKQTPYAMPDLVTWSRNLMAAKIPASEIVGDLRAIGDEASTLGISADHIARFMVQLQELANGAPIGRSLQNMAREQFRPYQDLITGLGLPADTSRDAAEKIAKAMNPQDMIQALMKGMETNFHDALKKQHDTLVGQLSDMLSSVWKDVVGMGNQKGLGTELMPALMEGVQGLKAAFDEVGKSGFMGNLGDFLKDFLAQLRPVLDGLGRILELGMKLTNWAISNPIVSKLLEWALALKLLTSFISPLMTGLAGLAGMMRGLIPGLGYETALQRLQIGWVQIRAQVQGLTKDETDAAVAAERTRLGLNPAGGTLSSPAASARNEQLAAEAEARQAATAATNEQDAAIERMNLSLQNEAQALDHANAELSQSIRVDMEASQADLQLLEDDEAVARGQIAKAEAFTADANAYRANMADQIAFHQLQIEQADAAEASAQATLLETDALLQESAAYEEASLAKGWLLPVQEKIIANDFAVAASMQEAATAIVEESNALREQAQASIDALVAERDLIDSDEQLAIATTDQAAVTLDAVAALRAETTADIDLSAAMLQASEAAEFESLSFTELETQAMAASEALVALTHINLGTAFATAAGGALTYIGGLLAGLGEMIVPIVEMLELFSQISRIIDFLEGKYTRFEARIQGEHGWKKFIDELKAAFFGIGMETDEQMAQADAQRHAQEEDAYRKKHAHDVQMHQEAEEHAKTLAEIAKGQYDLDSQQATLGDKIVENYYEQLHVAHELAGESAHQSAIEEIRLTQMKDTARVMEQERAAYGTYQQAFAAVAQQQNLSPAEVKTLEGQAKSRYDLTMRDLRMQLQQIDQQATNAQALLHQKEQAETEKLVQEGAKRIAEYRLTAAKRSWADLNATFKAQNEQTGFTQKEGAIQQKMSFTTDPAELARLREELTEAQVDAWAAGQHAINQKYYGDLIAGYDATGDKMNAAKMQAALTWQDDWVDARKAAAVAAAQEAEASEENAIAVHKAFLEKQTLITDATNAAYWSGQERGATDSVANMNRRAELLEAMTGDPAYARAASLFAIQTSYAEKIAKVESDLKDAQAADDQAKIIQLSDQKAALEDERAQKEQDLKAKNLAEDIRKSKDAQNALFGENSLLHNRNFQEGANFGRQFNMTPAEALAGIAAVPMAVPLARNTAQNAISAGLHLGLQLTFTGTSLVPQLQPIIQNIVNATLKSLTYQNQSLTGAH